MRTDFVLFGPAHLLIMAAIPSLAVVLARSAALRRRQVRLSLGVILLVNELVWYGYRFLTEANPFPGSLPLQLCDLALWLTVAALFTLKPWCYEAAYFLGLAGSGMAVLTPDLWAPSWSYPTWYFFLAHGGVMVSALFLTLARLGRPRPGCVLRVLAVTNLFALVVGAFNAVFHTNYMYLCRKPAGSSLLDYLGPWPWYLLGGELAALALFWLLWLPFRRAGLTGLAGRGGSSGPLRPAPHGGSSHPPEVQ